MSHETLDSKEISVGVGDEADDSTWGTLLSTEDKELTDCRCVLDNDPSSREKERRLVPCKVSVSGTDGKTCS